MVELLRTIYEDAQVKYLLALVIANLLLGIVVSIKRKDFRLTQVADWLETRVMPLMVGYGVAAFLAYVNTDLVWLKDAAWATLSLTMLGYVLANLKDFGVNIPETLAGRPNDG